MSLADAHDQLTLAGSPFEIENRVVRGIPRRVWKHGPKTMADLIERSRAFGDAPFLVLDEDRVSFRAFRLATQSLAASLAEYGVGKGDRVAVAMRNLPEWAVSFFAITVLGAVAVPLNAWWLGGELAFALNDAGAKVLIADGERLGRVRALLGECASLQHVLVCRAQDPAPATPLESIIGPPDMWHTLPERPLPASTVDADDEATIFYTSGTTGSPKGVVASHRAVLSNITGAAFAAARAALREGRALPERKPDEPQAGALVVVPFFHVTGCFAILCPALAAGNRLVLMRRFEPEVAMRLIEAEKLSWVIGVPTIAWQIAEHPRAGEYDLSSLVSVGYGGAAAAPELIDKLDRALPQAIPGHGWGMTETCGLATTHPAKTTASGRRAVGRPWP